MEYERYPCGCVLEWHGKCLELKVCSGHSAEYHKDYDLTQEDEKRFNDKRVKL